MYKYRYKIFGIILLLLILSNFAVFFRYSRAQVINAPHDVDRKANGNTLVCTTTFAEMFEHIDRRSDQLPMPAESDLHRIIEVNEKGEVVWEIKDLGIPHEVEELPNGHLLAADTSRDRIIEINYPNKNIIWSWEPEQINWTQVNPVWGANHYYNNPIIYDFTHMNDVEFMQYGSWNACLISIRNFDLIVEVNYTAELLGPSNNPANIVWWFGDYGNHSMINKQHNPDYLSNGNIIIADSQNNRIIEVNRTNKEIVWEYDEGLKWPRDADELENGRLLITDCFNNRIIEIDKESKEILWKYSRNTIIPYEADMLENGNVLISGDYGGKVVEVNRKGRVVWTYDKSAVQSAFYMNATFIVLMCMNGIFYQVSRLYKREVDKKERNRRITAISFQSLALLFFAFILVAYHFFIRVLIHIAYSTIGHEMF